MRTHALAPLLACLLAPLLAGTPALAQQAAEAPGVRLAGAPLRLESLGLTMHVPEGSTTQTSSFGTTFATQVVLEDKIGIITIQGRNSADQDLTPVQVGDGIVEKALGAYGKTGAAGQIASSRARVLSRNSSLVVGDQEMDRFYMELPPKADADPAPVNGYTIAVPEPGRVIIFELLTSAKDFERARAIYETCIATATFAPAGDLAARRAASVRAGVKVIESLTPDDYRDVFEAFGTRWERLYAPSTTGADADATESGYRRMKAWVGRRGELNPDKDPSRWNNTDQQPGYLLQIDARLLESTYVVDTQAVYFLSMDRSAEAWTVRMAIRQDGQVNRWTETGARTDHSMSVTTAHGSGAPTVVRPLVQGEGYISMVEAYMLAPLLAHAGVPSDFAFYAYQSRDAAIRMRQDSLERVGDTTWKLTSRLNEDAPPQVAYLSTDGEPIRTELADGRIWEPTSYDRLVKLWRAKELPLD